MLWCLVALFCVTSLPACTRSSKSDDVITDRGYVVSFDETFYVVVEVPFEDAWANVLLAVEDLDWTIDEEIETSGIITTDVLTMGTNRDRYACNEWMETNTRVDQLRSKLGVHVARVSETVSKVRVHADIQGRYVYVTTRGDERVGGWWQCNSTGELEGEIFDAFLSRLEPVYYDAPVFRQGMR